MRETGRKFECRVDAAGDGRAPGTVATSNALTAAKSGLAIKEGVFACDAQRDSKRLPDLVGE